MRELRGTSGEGGGWYAASRHGSHGVVAQLVACAGEAAAAAGWSAA